MRSIVVGFDNREWSDDPVETAEELRYIFDQADHALHQARRLAHQATSAARLRALAEQPRMEDDRDPETGNSRAVYSTAEEPDGTLLLACGNRRDSRCPSCSWTYRGDAFQLVTAGSPGARASPTPSPPTRCCSSP
ncbi:MAG: hypothetical protein M3O70_05930 [Actinomycetota bacterium]|nr:hypothetical protein [Actinomycetota bacterium]